MISVSLIIAQDYKRVKLPFRAGISRLLVVSTSNLKNNFLRLEYIGTDFCVFDCKVNVTDQDCKVREKNIKRLVN